MATGGDRRYARVHLQNVRIAAGARRHHFDERIGVPFLCECDDEECREFVIVGLALFERTIRDRHTVISLGHLVADSLPISRHDGYELVHIANGETRIA